MTTAPGGHASRAGSAAGTASRVGRYLRLEARKLGRLLREGRPGAFCGSVLELATGRNPYYERRAAGADRYRRVSVDGRELLVDVDDAGISRTLLAYGVHEYLSTTAFERELERLADAVDGPVTVLEVGANLGYFCSLEADVLGDRARILAVEPIPANVRLLERNLELNGIEGAVSVDRLAVGDATEPIEMELSTHSNQHRVRSAEGGSWESGSEPETVAVRQVTANRYLAERDVDPAAVHAVRLDVEGYERAVLEGAAAVLEAPGPTVLFAELHPLELSAVAFDAVATRLEATGFEVVSAVRTDAAAGVDDERRWHGLECGIDDFDDLRRAAAESDHSIELVARK